MAELIRMTDRGLETPDHPIIPFIEGDGTGPDIWAAAVRVFDAAVEKAYGGQRKIEWREVLAPYDLFLAGIGSQWVGAEGFLQGGSERKGHG